MRFALMIALVAPSLAFAGPNKSKVLDLLNAHHDAPSQADLDAIEGVEVELRELADDHETPSSRRARAMTSLKYYKSTETHTFLVDHVRDADKGILRRKAAYALAIAFPETAVKELTPAIDDADVQVRIAVVEALGMIDTDPAAELLASRLKVEKEDAVLEAIKKVQGAGGE